MSNSEPDYVRLLEQGLAGDDAALTTLVDTLTPIVQVRVARALRRRRGQARGRDMREDLEDMTQEVFAALFERQGRALKAWDPTRGLSFLSFVGFLSEREVAMRMRTAKRNPWTEDPTTDSGLVRAVGAAGSMERDLESRDLLVRILADLKQWLTPEGRQYFQLLYIDQRPVAEVAATAGTTAQALYAWRSRLVKKVRKIRDERLSETDHVGK